MTLEPKIIGDINCHFKIEAYQRGYRWTEVEIIHLLEDIQEIPNGNEYCLQPVVVKKVNDPQLRKEYNDSKDLYELIDGQQRITTLFLIIKYLGDSIEQKFSIEYVTRKSENGNVGSKELLDKIEQCDLNAPSSNIDELFIKKAYSTIKGWFDAFEDTKKIKNRFALKLQDNVSVIWYEVDESEDGMSIFTRLNIGKISLTNAELVKALFLSKGDGSIDDKYQHEIALKWDMMEKELHDEQFWAFITNADGDKYPVRMEMLFDIIEKKPSNEDNYYTFNSFSKKFKNSTDKYKTWETVVRYYQQLQEWYKNFDMFHRIGFLIAEKVSVKQLLDMALGDENPMTKTQFREKVIDMIREKVVFYEGKGDDKTILDYADLDYNKHEDYIHTLLLLFNVENIRQKGDENRRFPFERYKKEGTWSLEHIHAQNSEALNKNAEWFQWLVDHKKSMETLRDEYAARKDEKYKAFDAVIKEMDTIISHILDKNYTGSIRDEFNGAASKVVNFLSDGDATSQMHGLSNMALLTVGENAALKNSTFDVKRTKIIEMDRNGKYIPECTRNVFMKYYSDSDTNLHFWSQSDRDHYIEAMNDVLYTGKNNEGESDDKKLKLIYTLIRNGKQ